MWRCAAAALLAVGLAACTARRPAPPPAWTPRPFVITFWCGPPLSERSDARLAAIAAAGFTTIGAPCAGDLDVAANRAGLDAAARHGLRVWLADHRLYSAAGGDGDAAALAAAVAADFGAAPALDGYVVADEPTVPSFPPVAATVAALRAADPGRLAYVNLLPDYIPPAGLGAASYADYLEGFVATVRPQLLSVDYYPFGETRDRSSIFANLAAVRDTALRHDLPFLWIVLAMPHGPYRDPTAAELAWQVFHALAFGARGVSYFAYWTPPYDERDRFRRGLVEDGAATARHAEVATLNHELAALAAALAGQRSLAVADPDGVVGAPFPIGPIAAVDGGPVTAGLFGDGSGTISALLVNRDYRQPVSLQITARAAAAPAEAFDPRTRTWRPTALTIDLPAGGAALLRWPAR